MQLVLYNFCVVEQTRNGQVNMRKIGKAIIATVLASVMIGSTAFATPTVSELKEDKEKAEK